MATVVYEVRPVYLPGWRLYYGVYPVIDGWPNPRPVAMFDGATAAKQWRNHLNHTRSAA